MAYDEGLAGRVRDRLASRAGATEKKMFGGLCFLLGGRMCCGVLGRDLVVRVRPQDQGRALAAPHARPMDFTGRPLRGFVYVAPPGTRRAAVLNRWVELGIAAARAAPAPKRRAGRTRHAVRARGPAPKARVRARRPRT